MRRTAKDGVIGASRGLGLWRCDCLGLSRLKQCLFMNKGIVSWTYFSPLLRKHRLRGALYWVPESSRAQIHRNLQDMKYLHSFLIPVAAKISQMGCLVWSFHVGVDAGATTSAESAFFFFFKLGGLSGRTW